MKQEVIDQIVEMHEEGLSYAKIAEVINVSINTIKGVFYQRRQKGINDPAPKSVPRKICPCCEKKIYAPRANRVFCSDKCRHTYYNHHRTMRAKFTAEKKCPVCRNTFRYYPSSGQKYCSKECSLIGRYGQKVGA